MDKAHKATDKRLEVMEREIAAIYREAQKGISDKATAYFEQFIKQDEKKKALVADSKLSEDEYLQWRKNKILYSKRFVTLQGQITGELARVNQTAAAYINDQLPDVYALNYNYVGKGVQRAVKGYSFTLIDANTVRRLATKTDGLLPKRKVDVPKDKLWNAKKMRTQVLQGILQGESMDKIAKRLRNVQEMNKTQAIRSARTIVTGAENKGRQDSYARAEADGIILQKEWISTNDSRTRHSHAMLDGAIVDQDKKFENGLMYPGDPSGRPEEVYNCRCTIVAKVNGFKKAKVQKAMAEKPLYDIMGVSEKDIDISALPTEVQKIVEDSVRQSFEKFPQLKGHFTKIKYDESIEAIASSQSITGSVKLSKKFKDYKKLQKEYDYDVRLRWHPKGTTAQSTITHEIGHQLDGLLTKKGIYGGSVSQYGVTRTSVAVQKEVLSRIGLSDERLREIRKQYSDMGYTGKDLTHAVLFERKEFIEKNVCSYAAENSNEFFACLYAEYMDSPEPREAATIFGEILERIMGEIK